MAHLETNIRYLPLPYQCAIEMLDSAGDDRSEARLNGFIEHFERAYGLLGSADSSDYAASCKHIAARRFWNYKA